jgi:hypothetical protein
MLQRILKDKFYHGTNRIVDQFFVPNGVPCLPLTADIQSGDVVVLETPSNPRGRCYDIQSFASKCRLAGAKLLVDSVRCVSTNQSQNNLHYLKQMQSSLQIFTAVSYMILFLYHGLADICIAGVAIAAAAGR